MILEIALGIVLGFFLIALIAGAISHPEVVLFLGLLCLQGLLLLAGVVVAASPFLAIGLAYYLRVKQIPWSVFFSNLFS